jgi:hypothetical protein
MAITEIIEFARERGCDVARRGEAHAIKIDASPLSVEVMVPDDVLEWFVAVSDSTGREIYSEWCDHFPDQGDEDLNAEMTASVRAFISAIRPGCLRVVQPESGPFFTQLEALVDEAWVPIWQPSGRLTGRPPPTTVAS